MLLPSYHLNIVYYAHDSGNFYKITNIHLIFKNSDWTGTIVTVTFPEVTAGSVNGPLVLTKIMNQG